MICERVTAENRDAVNTFIRRQWYTTTMVIRGETVDMTVVEGFFFGEKEDIQGLITYRISDDILEITSLDSLRENQGIGSALLERTILEARERKCRKVVLITTNDNLNALRFYQKRGFDLARLYRNAVDLARDKKPEIPLVGDFGIPLHHEIELEQLI